LYSEARIGKPRSSAVLAECKPRHRRQEFLAFLRTIDKSVPVELDIHCIVDYQPDLADPLLLARPIPDCGWGT
jgi:hypothetical protein